MTRFATMTVFAAAVWLVGAAAPGQAQTTKPGDCNENDEVVINELIICVNIASGVAQLSTCPAADRDDDGMVEIQELIQAVNCAGGVCTIPTTAVCGNTMREADETCDDGNTQGGDGCAANCTTEVRRETPLDSTRSKATAQLGPLALPLTLTGTQAITAGRPRQVATIGAGNAVLFPPREFPILIKAADVNFNPVRIPGLACACIRGFAREEFGPGISSQGKVSCAEEGLTDIDFLSAQDHNTTPGSPGNSGPENGLEDDPDCTAIADAGNGVHSEACLEGTGEDCSEARFEHIGVCQSPRVVTFSGGPAGRGSVLLFNCSAIGLLQDQGLCAERRLPNGDCAFPDYGPDCLPCTDDDEEKGEPNVAPTTSGTAEVVIYDVGSFAGAVIGPGVDCGTLPCVASVSGEPTDCDALEADPNAPLTGALVTAFGTLDAEMVGDNVVTSTFAAQQP